MDSPEKKRRRLALESMTKSDLVEVVLRLQEDLRASRAMVSRALEAGVDVGRAQEKQASRASEG